MSDVPPDRLSVDPSSPFYDEATLARGIGVRFRGVERRDVEEYSVSEGWIRAAAGKALDLQVVAEGVEMQVQAKALQALGCQVGQGFLYSAAVTGTALLVLMGTADLTVGGE